MIQVEERYKNLQAKLETSEQKYDQLLKKSQLNNLNNSNDATDSLPKSLIIAQVRVCVKF